MKVRRTGPGGAPARSAVFLDRDGVINAMIQVGDEVDSPLRVEQVALLPRAGAAIRKLKEAGLPVIVVSNQPVIAKGKTSPDELDRITQSIQDSVEREGGAFDAVYYCLHHPHAVVKDLKAVCECRKPAPGLLHRAAVEHNLHLPGSFMVGDRITDIQAGQEAGCTTVLVTGSVTGCVTGSGGGPAITTSTTAATTASEAQADHMATDLYEAASWILARMRTDESRTQTGSRASEST